jgi:hypothetical protein
MRKAYLFMGYRCPPLSYWMKMPIRDFFDWLTVAGEFFKDAM